MVSRSISEELERSFGDGPGHRPVEESLRAGHRALARRRGLGAAAALALVVAVGGTAWAMGPGNGPAPRGAGVATDPTPAASDTPSPSPETPPADAPWHGKDTVRYVDGELEIRPGVTVHERIRNPYDYRPPKLSDALDLTFRGQRMWVITEQRPAPLGSTMSISEPSNGWASFAAYVADQVAVDSGRGSAGSGWPDTLRLNTAGTVVATAGSQVLQRTDDPQLGDSFAGPGDPTGAALVRAGADSFTYFVVWRVIDGQLDVITTPARDPGSGGPTFAELVDQARAQYASGEGLR